MVCISLKNYYHCATHLIDPLDAPTYFCHSKWKWNKKKNIWFIGNWFPLMWYFDIVQFEFYHIWAGQQSHRCSILSAQLNRIRNEIFAEHHAWVIAIFNFNNRTTIRDTVDNFRETHLILRLPIHGQCHYTIQNGNAVDRFLPLFIPLCDECFVHIFIVFLTEFRTIFVVIDDANL